MSNIDIRQAALDDTADICAIARSRISVWQHINAEGDVEDVPYETLSVFERWLHGGPWMSVETGAIHLCSLLLGSGVPLVARVDGKMAAYAEAYLGNEPEPFGRHLHIANVTLYQEFHDQHPDDALIQALVTLGRDQGCKRLTANCSANDHLTEAFYQRHSMTQLENVRRMHVPSRSGQVFYKAVELSSTHAEQIKGMHFNIGRLGSARHQWEALMPRTWDALPEVKARRSHRLHFAAAGNDAFVSVREQLYAPRTADIAVWTPKPPTSQLITAIRDWAHREGYRRLVLPVLTSTVSVLGLDAEPDGYEEHIYSLPL